jgi:bifunctional non-homologous end joining protein LigD
MATKLSSKKSRRRQPEEIPNSIEPMLALMGQLPEDQEKYTFEYKWDGVRAIGYFAGGSYHLKARSGNDITSRYPELRDLAQAIGKRNVIVDGEIVSFNDSGRPDFGRLQHRMHLNDARSIAYLSELEPVFYVLFDILYADGRSLLNETQSTRRIMLEELTLLGSHWQVTPAHIGEGTAMLETAKNNQLEGLVAKRLDSPYRPGQRSEDWIKIKMIQRQEFVVAGYIPERTGFSGRIGALLTGYYDCDGKLRYAGKVGTGLSAVDHEPLLKRLHAKTTHQSPFEDAVPAGAVFTKKPIVAEIEYRRWPAGGLLQQAAFKGVRDDKSPKEVVRESPV